MVLSLPAAVHDNTTSDIGGSVRDSDGRLDLDDLGSVIDHADVVDADVVTGPDRAEVLDDGRGRTWGDRLEDAGISAWLRRHRVAVLAGTTALVLVVGGSTWYLADRPPPLDPTLRVTASEVLSSATITMDDGTEETINATGLFGRPGGVLHTAYGLTPQQDGDTSTYAVVGIVGDGIRASMAHPHPPVTTGQPFANDVSLVLDCDDVSALDPTSHSYHLTVSRTDTYGRTVTGPVEVPLIAGSESWTEYVASSCLSQRALTALTVRSLAATPKPADHTVALSVAVNSTLQVPATVGAEQPSASPAGINGGPGITYTAPRTALAPGGEAVVPVTVQLTDCAAPAFADVFLPGAQPRGQEQTGVPGLFLELTSDNEGRSRQASTALRWTPAQKRTIDAAISATCAGAPPVTLTLVDIATGPPVAPLEGSGPRMSLRTTWSVATTASTVEFRSREPVPGEDVRSSFTPATVPVRAGRATVTSTWTFDYSNGFVDPPTVHLVLTTPEGSYPFERQITSTRLAEAVVARIPGVTLVQLQVNGWGTGADSATTVTIDRATGTVT